MSAVTNLKAFDSPKKLKAADVPWAEILWVPLKEHLAKKSDIKGSRPADRQYAIYKVKSINAQICPWYNLKGNLAGVGLETYGGDEVKAVIEDRLSKLPADSLVANAEISQGKKNKNKWAWVVSANMDKKDTNLISFPHGLPELLAIGVVAILHFAKHNTLLSIAGGTVCYMLLVQFVFR